MPHTVDEIALVLTALRKNPKTIAVHLIILPFALLLSSHRGRECAVSTFLTILKLAIIYISFVVDVLSLTIKLVINIVTLVHSTVGPNLDSAALSNAGAYKPLSIIVRSII